MRLFLLLLPPSTRLPHRLAHIQLFAGPAVRAFHDGLRRCMPRQPVSAALQLLRSPPRAWFTGGGQLIIAPQVRATYANGIESRARPGPTDRRRHCRLGHVRAATEMRAAAVAAADSGAPRELRRIAVPGPRLGMIVYILGPMLGGPLGAWAHEALVRRALLKTPGAAAMR